MIQDRVIREFQAGARSLEAAGLQVDLRRLRSRRRRGRRSRRPRMLARSARKRTCSRPSRNRAARTSRRRITRRMHTAPHSHGAKPTVLAPAAIQADSKRDGFGRRNLSMSRHRMLIAVTAVASRLPLSQLLHPAFRSQAHRCRGTSAVLRQSGCTGILGTGFPPPSACACRIACCQKSTRCVCTSLGVVYGCLAYRSRPMRDTSFPPGESNDAQVANSIGSVARRGQHHGLLPSRLLRLAAPASYCSACGRNLSRWPCNAAILARHRQQMMRRRAARNAVRVDWSPPMPMTETGTVSVHDTVELPCSSVKRASESSRPRFETRAARRPPRQRPARPARMLRGIDVALGMRHQVRTRGPSRRTRRPHRPASHWGCRDRRSPAPSSDCRCAGCAAVAQHELAAGFRARRATARSRGTNLPSACATGRYIVLDAGEEDRLACRPCRAAPSGLRTCPTRSRSAWPAPRHLASSGSSTPDLIRI